jgi:hypothetical protein
MQKTPPTGVAVPKMIQQAPPAPAPKEGTGCYEYEGCGLEPKTPCVSTIQQLVALFSGNTVRHCCTYIKTSLHCHQFEHLSTASCSVCSKSHEAKSGENTLNVCASGHFFYKCIWAAEKFQVLQTLPHAPLLCYSLQGTCKVACIPSLQPPCSPPCIPSLHASLACRVPTKLHASLHLNQVGHSCSRTQHIGIHSETR